MSARQTPPFRAEHVGSLLRPADLAAARDKARTGDLPLSELVPIEDENVRAAVALQEDIGLGAVTDGEYRRGYWHLDFMVGFDGVELSDETYGMAFSARKYSRHHQGDGQCQPTRDRRHDQPF